MTAPSSGSSYFATINSDPFSTEKYFSVGSAMFFKLKTTSQGRTTGDQMSTAAIGIGLSANNLNGYILKIATSQQSYLSHLPK